MKLFEIHFYPISGLMLGAEWVHSEAALVVDILLLRMTFYFGEADEEV